MAFIVLLIVIVILLFAIWNKRERGYHGIFARKCPHCRELIHPKATRCEFCGGEVEPERWIWQRPRGS